MGTPYSSTFPLTPPADPDDPSSVASHDQHAFEHVEQMLSHWERPHRLSYHWMISLGRDAGAIELSQRCQALLPSHGLDRIPAEGLNLTVRRLGYVDEVSLSALNSAIANFGGRCRNLSSFRLRLLPLAGSPGALRLSVAPWSPLMALYESVSKAAACNGADPMRTFRPHVGIAYNRRVQPSQPFIEAAQQARSIPPVDVTIGSVEIVELYRSDHQYRWRTVEEFPLGPLARS